MKVTAALRGLLKKEEYIEAPSAYDAISARIIERAGFKLINTTGSGIMQSQLAKPDIATLTMSEIVAHHRNMASAVDIPIIADSDTGYGNAINVIRATREWEKAGVAGFFIEDQLWPRAHPDVGIYPPLISMEEMIGKVKAAAEARMDKDFVIIGRTDAVGEEAIKRGNAYVKAGADMVKIIPRFEPGTKKSKISETLKKWTNEVEAPLHISNVRGFTSEDLGRMGFKIISNPMGCLFPAVKAIIDAMNELKTKGTLDGFKRMPTAKDMDELIGASKIAELKRKYLPWERR